MGWKLWLAFGISVRRQYDGQIIYGIEGRGFVLAELKKAIIAASGGFAVGLWLVWEQTAVWKLIEAIELVSMVQEQQNKQ